jgi:hypothetical protein
LKHRRGANTAKNRFMALKEKLFKAFHEKNAINAISLDDFFLFFPSGWGCISPAITFMKSSPTRA